MNCNVSVPCGRCPLCIKRRISQWSFRLMQEEKRSTHASFVTLTYDEKFLTHSRNGYATLVKKDCQDFMKRLRFNVSQVDKTIQLKFYIIGEYGDEGKRPHYHLILFNCPSTKHIERAWNRGIVHYGTVTGASVGYTLQYISKPTRIPEHRNDDRLPEFSLMSKGLGANYLTPEMVAWHEADMLARMYVNIDNKKVSMPRYYKDKIYKQYQRNMIAEHQRNEADKKLDQALARNPNHFRDTAELHLQQFEQIKVTYKKRCKI